jgi:hypothetical protein
MPSGADNLPFSLGQFVTEEGLLRGFPKPS